MEDLIPCFTSSNRSASRRDFWLGSAMLFGVSLILGMIPVLGTIAVLAILYPWTCLSMCRLNDMGRSPRWALLPLALCLGTGLLGLLTSAELTGSGLAAQTLALAGVTLLVSAVAALVTVIFLLWIGLSADDRQTARAEARS